MSAVPCGECYICCRGWSIELDESIGEHEKYESQIDNGIVVVKKASDGFCVYLVSGKCSIHNDKPKVCSSFDCRTHYAKEYGPDLWDVTAEAMAEIGMLRLDIFYRGKELSKK